VHLLHHSLDACRLVSRPIGDVMREAENLVRAGSGIARDLTGHQRLWGRCPLPHRLLERPPIKTRMTELADALGSLGVWVRLHYVYPYPTWTKSSR